MEIHLYHFQINFMERVGTGWNRLEQVGTGLEQVGTGRIDNGTDTPKPISSQILSV